jgi:uncharacterized protein
MLMLEPSHAFARYIDNARRGPMALWRVFIGALLVAAIWLAWTLAAFLTGAALSGQLAIVAGAREADRWSTVDRLLNTPPGMAMVFCSFAGIWAGVWLALRLLHGRPLSSILGADRRISWGNLLRGFITAFAIAALSEAAFYIVDPTIVRSRIGIGEWLSWLPLLASLLLVQTSAEELAFRGYLTQSLAALFRTPLIWAGLPTVFFALLHWDGAASPAMNAAALASIAAFAIAATILLHRTGDLGAAIGVHWGMNLFAILIVSRTSWLSGAAILKGRAVNEGTWTAFDATWLALTSFATFGAILWLLLASHSPLRVRAT